MEAADKTDSPVIVQRPRGSIVLARRLPAASDVGCRRTVSAHSIVMHQDHGNSRHDLPDRDRQRLHQRDDGRLAEGRRQDAGGSTTTTWSTSEVVRTAHAQVSPVEANSGVPGLANARKGDKEDGHGVEGTMTRDQSLTDPEKPRRFRRGDPRDALAVAIGTSHGAYKFTRKPDGEVLAMTRIEGDPRAIPNTHLVMTASSRAAGAAGRSSQVRRQDEADLRRAGEEIVTGIRSGVRKVNVDTDIPSCDELQRCAVTWLKSRASR